MLIELVTIAEWWCCRDARIDAIGRQDLISFFTVNRQSSAKRAPQGCRVTFLYIKIFGRYGDSVAGGIKISVPKRDSTYLLPRVKSCCSYASFRVQVRQWSSLKCISNGRMNEWPCRFIIFWLAAERAEIITVCPCLWINGLTCQSLAISDGLATVVTETVVGISIRTARRRRHKWH